MKYYIEGENSKYYKKNRYEEYLSILRVMGIAWKIEIKGDFFRIEFESSKKQHDEIIDRIMKPSKYEHN